MGILWYGGEDIDFPFGEKPTTFATIYNRSGYARCGIGCVTSAWSNTFPGGGITSGWLHCQIYPSSSFGPYLVVGLVADNGWAGYWIGKGTNTYRLYKYTASGYVQVDEEAGTSVINANMQSLDMCLTNYGASGNIKVYFNGTEIIDYTADLTISGVTEFTRVGLAGSHVGGRATLSEIIVANEDTRNMSLVTLAPNAAGDVNSWTGAYTDIDETAWADTDLIYTDTDGNQFMCNLSTLPTGTFTIRTVKMAVRASRTGSPTPTSLDVGVKSGGSVDVADNHALSLPWLTYERFMDLNPITSSAWSGAEITALQAVVEAEA